MNNARARNTLMVLDARWAVSSALSTKSWRQVRVVQDGNQRGCFVRALGSSHSSHVTGSVGDHRHRLRLRMLVIRGESRTCTHHRSMHRGDWPPVSLFRSGGADAIRRC
jgi:hypothetical protein